MASEANGEGSYLLASQEPHQTVHNFQRVLVRRRRRLRQFQCCVCCIFLFATLVALMFAISYNMHRASPNGNSTSQVTLLGLTWPLEDERDNSAICVDPKRLEIAIEFAKRKLESFHTMAGLYPILDDLNSPSFRHRKAFSKDPDSWRHSRLGYVAEFAQRYLLDDNNHHKRTDNVTCDDGKIFLVELDDRGARVECDRISGKYRTYDGTCNNPNRSRHDAVGSAFVPFRRILLPDYADKVGEPRKRLDGTSLPSALKISNLVHRPIYKNDDKFTVMLAVWGQFIDHDITATALVQGPKGQQIACCSQELNHPDCFDVMVDKDDSYFADLNVTCIDFIRSAPVRKSTLGPREQMNQVTSYLDASVVYGSEFTLANKLRALEGGKLKMFVTPDNRTLLPTSNDTQDGCNQQEQNARGRYCFLTGDQRANENLHLTSMHLIWARHHNRIAETLSNLNPHWNDETLFQEARRIVAAQIQHITYNEFLPVVLGTNMMKKANISILENDKFYEHYDPNIDPTIANSFATAAFRFGHTLIPELIRFLNDSSYESVQMRHMLFDPYMLYEQDGLRRSITSAISSPAEPSDAHFSSEIKNHLFEKTSKQSKPCGLDLVALNIQRGRDHGLPGYVRWRRKCGLSVPKNFHQLAKDVDEESLKRIAEIYRDIHDIDLYTGAISEKPLPGGLVGPTFTCLLTDQFVRLKRGDLMWHENSPSVQGHSAFTSEQLIQIRTTSLAGVICQNADNLDKIQRSVMMQGKTAEDYVLCDRVPRLDLSSWREERAFESVSLGDGLGVLVKVVDGNNFVEKTR